MNRLEQLELGLKDLEMYLRQVKAEQDTTLIKYFEAKKKQIMAEILELTAVNEQNESCEIPWEDESWMIDNKEVIDLETAQLRAQLAKTKEMIDNLVEKIAQEKIARTKKNAATLNEQEELVVNHFLIKNEDYIYSQIHTQIIKILSKPKIRKEPASLFICEKNKLDKVRVYCYENQELVRTMTFDTAYDAKKFVRRTIIKKGDKWSFRILPIS